MLDQDDEMIICNTGTGLSKGEYSNNYSEAMVKNTGIRLISEYSCVSFCFWHILQTKYVGKIVLETEL